VPHTNASSAQRPYPVEVMTPCRTDEPATSAHQRVPEAVGDSSCTSTYDVAPMSYLTDRKRRVGRAQGIGIVSAAEARAAFTGAHRLVQSAIRQGPRWLDIDNCTACNLSCRHWHKESRHVKRTHPKRKPPRAGKRKSMTTAGRE
jgi:hypothetical protein